MEAGGKEFIAHLSVLMCTYYIHHGLLWVPSTNLGPPDLESLQADTCTDTHIVHFGQDPIYTMRAEQVKNQQVAG